MDLPQVGSHCALASCNVLDFLPITCQCNRKYCAEHISPGSHNCSSMTVKHDMTSFADKIRRCFVEGCNKPSLKIYNGDIEETCSFCHKLLCPEYVSRRIPFHSITLLLYIERHRHPDLHVCPSAVGKVNIGRAPKTLPSYSSPTTPIHRKINDPIKLAQWKKVQLMKMRHHAIPADPRDRNGSPPIEERLHIRLTTNDSDKLFWFRKVCVGLLQEKNI